MTQLKDSMSNIEKIRQEIEKRIRSIENCPFIEADFGASTKRDGKLIAYKDLLAFIDSLPEETSYTYDTNKLTPTPSVNIEDVARVQFASHAHVFDRKRKAVFDWEQFKEVAWIFYGFGKRDSMPEEDPSEDLEEAAQEYAIPFNDTTYGCEYSYKGFIAGAEWQAKQLLKGSPLPEDTVLFQKGVNEGRRLEKDDLALTWEDMAKIDAIILDVNNEFAVDYSKEIDRQKFYEEVLKRFKDAKE